MKQTAPTSLDISARLRPWLLMAATALLVARPLFPSESAADWGDGASAVMLWILLAVVWLLGEVASGRFAVRFGWLDAAVVLLVFWQIIAALWAVINGSPRPAMNMLWEWVGMALGFLLLRQLLGTGNLIDVQSGATVGLSSSAGNTGGQATRGTHGRECRALLAVMIALAVGLSGYALYQRAYEYPQTLARYDADPDGELQKAGYDYPPGSPQRKLFRDRLASNLPSATFALSNSLAGFLAPWLVILVGIAASELQNLKRFSWLILCACLITAGLLITRGRGGCIAAGVGCVLLAVPWAWNKARRLGWLLPVAAAAVAIVAVFVAVSQRNVFSQAAKSFGYRVQYWQSSMAMIAEHPWLGCGPGNFQNAYTKYKLPEASEEIADPHNFLLEVWATAGSPAAVLLLVVLGGFFWTAARGQGPGASGRKGEKDSLPSPACGRGAWGEGGKHPSKSALTLALSQSERERTYKSRIPESLNPESRPVFILAGGGLGFILSIPLGMLGAAPPGLMAILIGLPLAGLTVAALWGWVCDGWLPPLLPALGAAVLLINLLAAGGIAMPGVAGTLWALMAVGLYGRWPGVLSRATAWLVLVAALCMAAACYFTYYRPVLDSQMNMRMAEQNPEQAVEWLNAAAKADPLAAEPWRRLMVAKFANYPHNLGRESLDHLHHTVNEFLRLNPNSASAWMTVGDWYSFLAPSFSDTTEDSKREIQVEALGAYRRAVDLYPNGAIQRAKLALALHQAGDWPAFRHEAKAALRLDEITPHEDKKLPPEVREQLTRLLQEKP
jgi:O-antigen ligase